MRRSAAYLGLSLAFLLLGAGYAAVVPAGEAPDEPAHLAYIDYLVRFRSLPPKPAPPYGLSYEAHQPPLDHGVSAACLAALGGGGARMAVGKSGAS
ncbi:MAG TPA: hypothetical protein VHQ90_02035 [Thermoanaerobaculia bacterium]|nr:hypothetical protein [Thermoanaerobaculia bacterium]